MSVHDLNGRSNESYSASAHLLGMIQGVVNSGRASRIVLPGAGELAIVPSKNAYYSNVQDMAGFCRSQVSAFQLVEGSEADILGCATGTQKRIRDLLWSAALHASEGRLIDGCTKYDVVKFRHWPNLTRLPITQNSARIAALLTHHSCTIMLVPRVLSVNIEEVNEVYSAAYSCGIAQVISRPDGALEDRSKSIEAIELPPQPNEERGFFRALFEKISGL